MSLFVSIASYQDPVLPFTLQRAVQQARWPERLHLAVVDQSPAGRFAVSPAQLAPARLSWLHIDPRQARGPCWARALAMTLYADEDWFLQIDSHMDFDPDWDATLIAALERLQARQDGCVISSYPNGFELVEGQPVRHAVTDAVLAHVVKPGSGFAPDHPVLGFEAHPVDAREPVRGFHLGAGCLFGPGELVQRFPYDPHLYFHGEEQALAARLFTHGWDIFHMPGLPLAHLYRVPGATVATRPLHWDADQDAGRAVTWWALEQRSRARVRALLQEGQDLGVYGLGRVRSLGDYADFCGIDYRAGTLAARAYSGPWHPPA